jgi:hypothetical protein
MLTKTRARLTIKIRPKLVSCTHRYFTKHIEDVFEKLPFENGWNKEILSFFNLIAQDWTGFRLQALTHRFFDTRCSRKSETVRELAVFIVHCRNNHGKGKEKVVLGFSKLPPQRRIQGDEIN